jgi:deazaflavin-dependent oxidoreductase (nitroreductase family)
MRGTTVRSAAFAQARRLGGTQWGVRAIGRVVSPVQRELYRRTGGRLSLTGSAPVLLLTTVGRRTGLERTVPLLYLHEDGRLVVCNVNPGFERTNPWVLNLRAQPHARVQLRRETFPVEASEATPEELDRYWPHLTKLWPAYQRFFDQGGKRTVFVLHREDGHTFPTPRRVPTSRRVRAAATTITVADLSILVWGALALRSPQQMIPGYENYTGNPWTALTQQDPATAAYMLVLFRLVGAFNIAVAIPLVAVTLTAFRAQKRWAWWTLLAGNTLAFAAPISYDLTTGAIGVFEVVEWLLLAAVYGALAATRPGARRMEVAWTFNPRRGHDQWHAQPDA